MPNLILASASPRRSQLLSQINLNHHIEIPAINETPLCNESASDYVTRVAHEKAQAIFQKTTDNSVVLAADTAVILNQHIMGKPHDLEDALAMLSQLANTTHQVYSAISILGQQQQHALSVSHVTFRNISEQEIIQYWHTGEPADKAGSYAIQGLGSVFIETIQGSFSGIMGLPLFETTQLLANEGIYVFK